MIHRVALSCALFPASLLGAGAPWVELSLLDAPERGEVAIQVEDSDAKKIRDWIPDPSQNLDRMIQNAVERVFKVLDLPRKADIEDLNRNLEKIAKAVQKLEKSSKKTPDED